MGRPGPLVAIFLVLAAAGVAVAVLLRRTAADAADPLAHARSSDDASPAAAAATEGEPAPPVRALEPEAAPPPPAADPDAEEEGATDPPRALDFKPSREQIEQLRKLNEALRDTWARQIALGSPADQMKDARLRKFIEARLARSDRASKAALKRVNTASDAALDEKARDISTGLRPDDSAKEVPYAIVRSSRTTRDGKTLEVVVREGDSPELDHARAAYEELCDRRRDLVLAIFDLALKSAR